MDEESDLVAIKKMLNQYAKGFNTGDLDFWISLWADDGVQMPPNAPAMIWKDQIQDNMKPKFDRFNMNIEIDIVEAKVFGDLGLTRCTYSLDRTPKAGGDLIHAMADGKALTLYERQSDGSWKIVYDCFNSNLPPKQG